MKNVLCIAAILGGFVALQWHDAYTEERIARYDAAHVRTVECVQVATR